MVGLKLYLIFQDLSRPVIETGFLKDLNRSSNSDSDSEFVI